MKIGADLLSAACGSVASGSGVRANSGADCDFIRTLYLFVDGSDRRRGTAPDPELTAGREQRELPAIALTAYISKSLHQAPVGPKTRKNAGEPALLQPLRPGPLAPPRAVSSRPADGALWIPARADTECGRRGWKPARKSRGAKRRPGAEPAQQRSAVLGPLPRGTRERPARKSTSARTFTDRCLRDDRPHRCRFLPRTQQHLDQPPAGEVPAHQEVGLQDQPLVRQRDFAAGIAIVGPAPAGGSDLARPSGVSKRHRSPWAE